MNARIFTGWLPQDAEEAWAPRTADHGPLPRLVFAVKVKDSRGVEFEDKCLLDEPALIAKYRPLLTAGRAVIVQGEQTAREWHERGVLKGYVREVRVFALEFPHRGKPKEEAAAEPGPTERGGERSTSNIEHRTFNVQR